MSAGSKTSTGTIGVEIGGEKLSQPPRPLGIAKNLEPTRTSCVTLPVTPTRMMNVETLVRPTTPATS